MSASIIEYPDFQMTSEELAQAMEKLGYSVGRPISMVNKIVQEVKNLRATARLDGLLRAEKVRYKHALAVEEEIHKNNIAKIYNT